MNRTATIVLTVLGTLAALALVGLGVLFSGAYNVAATADHWPVTHWALNTLQQASVGARAADAGVVPIARDRDALAHGFEHYDAMCVVCHGAPGVERGEFGKGMNPTPPDLVEEAEEWSDAELFWIIRNGIRMAGMPAFGPTHSDDEIRGLVAVTRLLPDLTPEEYRARVAAVSSEGGAEDETGHGHAEGSAGHTHGGDTDGHTH